MSLEAEMLAHIKAGVDHHNATCPMPARAILLNSGNYELFGWDERARAKIAVDQRRSACANPDAVVEQGDHLIYCAGAVADLYGELGGEVHALQLKTEVP